MFQILTENEKMELNYLMDDYKIKGSNPFPKLQPKINNKNINITMISLQEKGYISFEIKDLGNMEMYFITLKDKFFKYFNINTNQ